MTQIELFKDKPLLADKIELTPTSLTVTGELTKEDVDDAWGTLALVYGGTQWWVGGLAQQTPKKHGRYDELAVRHGLDKEAVRKYKEVCERVQNGIRIPFLYFGHHQVVAYLEPADQREWLKKAEVGDGEKQWTVSKLRNEIKTWEAEKELEDAPIPNMIDSNIVLGNSLEVEWPQDIDLLLTDPPYGLTVGNESGVRSGKGSWDEFDYEELHEFNKAWIAKVKRSLAPDGSLVVFGSLHNAFNVGHILKAHGFYIIRDIVWNKPFVQRQVNLNSLVPSHELIIWARLGDKNTCNLYEITRDVWDIQPEKLFGHPTEKPEAIAEKIISMASNPGDLVADPFCGSGVFPAMAGELKRRYWGCERDEHWWAIAQQRVGNDGI